MQRWVQEALRCIRGGADRKYGEKDEADDMEGESLQKTQDEPRASDYTWAVAINEEPNCSESSIHVHQGMGQDQVISQLEHYRYQHQYQPRGTRV